MVSALVIVAFGGIGFPVPALPSTEANNAAQSSSARVCLLLSWRLTAFFGSLIQPLGSLVVSADSWCAP
jgi:hypothetical protein